MVAILKYGFKNNGLSLNVMCKRRKDHGVRDSYDWKFIRTSEMKNFGWLSNMGVNF